jgi:hypothetical protein
MDKEELEAVTEAVDNLLFLSQRTGIGIEHARDIKRSFISLLKENGLEAFFDTSHERIELGIFKKVDGTYQKVLSYYPLKANWPS